MSTVRTALVILAIVCFALAAWGVATPRGNLVAAGLLCLSFAWLLGI